MAETRNDLTPAVSHGISLPWWTLAFPAAGALALLAGLAKIGPSGVIFATLVLFGCVIAAVHHAEVVAHRVGEPFGTLVLAIAVTVIEGR